jgi:uncharacterized protein
MVPQLADITSMSSEWMYPDGFDPRWTPRFPEVAAVANAVSMAMPHVEPFVIQAVRRVADRIDDPALQSQLQRFVREEATHHAQHRRFNNLVMQRYPRLRLVDRCLNWTMRRLAKRSASIGTGFAAGFELAGLAVAVWLAPRVDLLFAGADPAASALFLWHLGEEVDHRSIAHDIHRAAGGGTISAFVGLILSLVVLAVSAFAGAVIVFAADRRWLRPVAWWRLVTWGIGFLWISAPLFLSSMWRHPSDFLAPAESGEWKRLRPNTTESAVVGPEVLHHVA